MYIAATVLASMAAGAALSHVGMTTKPDVEKCYGVAKTGKNDCASKDGANSCAGLSTQDGDARQWVYVPKGLCEKLKDGTKG